MNALGIGTALLATAVLVQSAVPEDPLLLTADEVDLALEFSPLGPPPPDPSNRWYEDERAARFGQALFFDERLSGAGDVSCATCHDPAQGWGDGRELAKAVAFNPRHTMTLWNVAHNRWFFWDGRKDTLWSQALGPFEDPREHNGSRLQIVHTIAKDEGYRRAYEELFGPLPDFSDEERFPAQGRPVPRVPEHPHQVAWSSMQPEDQERVNEVYVHLGKSIAAYERKIVSDDAPWDRFVEGLRDGDEEKLRAISPAAQRGFALFVGKGNCHFCHDGPNFTDGEFHPNRVPTGEGVDYGRPTGIELLKADPFNLASKYADDGGEAARLKHRFTPSHAHLPGEFKTPTLRNVARTAPYMHEGQMKTLEEVVEFYSTLENAEPLGPSKERLLKPLFLTEEEKRDLVAFLESLTDDSFPAELSKAPSTPWTP